MGMMGTLMALLMHHLLFGMGHELRAGSATDPGPFRCPEGLFFFGASFVDTGNSQYAAPSKPSDPDNSPYGETFFGQPARRFCDGRLITDFTAQAFGFPLVAPYLQENDADFRHGANFAFSGSPLLVEFAMAGYVHFEVEQALFIDFKRNVEQHARAKAEKLSRRSSESGGHGREDDRSHVVLPTRETLDTGLYTFKFNLGNDLNRYLLKGTIAEVHEATAFIPKLAGVLSSGIEVVYNNGARTILVFNSPPLGCTPEILTAFTDVKAFPRDQFGCVRRINEISKQYNILLESAIEKLRVSLTGSTILLFDTTAANDEIFGNPHAYGFLAEKLTEACCGVGGNHNYNHNLRCGHTGTFNGSVVTVGSCDSPGRFVNWDGVHNTEAFYREITKFVLTGKFLDPPLNLRRSCNLDFSKFTGVNFTEAYHPFTVQDLR